MMPPDAWNRSDDLSGLAFLGAAHFARVTPRPLPVGLPHHPGDGSLPKKLAPLPGLLGSRASSLTRRGGHPIRWTTTRPDQRRARLATWWPSPSFRRDQP